MGWEQTALTSFNAFSTKFNVGRGDEEMLSGETLEGTTGNRRRDPA
jgi:hypothetical protein